MKKAVRLESITIVFRGDKKFVEAKHATDIIDDDGITVLSSIPHRGAYEVGTMQEKIAEVIGDANAALVSSLNESLNAHTQTLKELATLKA